MKSKQTLLSEIQGKYGNIKVMQSQRQITEADEEIHTLIARILLKKEKRLASRGI